MSENTTEVIRTETTQVIEPEPITTEDEEYKWLTERLDAHTREQQETRLLMQTQMEAIREANQNSLSESRTLIQSLTEMVTSANQTLTALAASAMLRSTPSNLPITSTEPEPAVIVESPENVVEENPEPRTELEVKKRRKL